MSMTSYMGGFFSGSGLTASVIALLLHYQEPREVYLESPPVGILALPENTKLAAGQGLMMLGVCDKAGEVCQAVGDYAPIQVDAKGYLKCKPDPKAVIGCRCLSEEELAQ